MNLGLEKQFHENSICQVKLLMIDHSYNKFRVAGNEGKVDNCWEYLMFETFIPSWNIIVEESVSFQD